MESPPLGGLIEAPLGPPHLAACLQLDQDCLQGLWTPAQWRAELADGQRPSVGLWAGDVLVALACGWLIVDELHVTLVAVQPALRRRGLGRRVLSALLEEARRRGAGAATLEVNAGNGGALALYRALGFTTRGCRRGYYREGGDALIQWAALNSADATQLDITPEGCG